MKAVSRVHITPHMHWDREWYFTTEESRILLVNNMEEILTRRSRTTSINITSLMARRRCWKIILPSCPKTARG